MESSLSEADAEEASAAQAYESLKAAKSDEIAQATSSIESKSTRSGTLAVQNVENKGALDDATVELNDSEKYLANLKVVCEEKSKEWTARRGMRSQEVSAISEAISVLNDDDALDIFKKAVPSAALLETRKKGKFLQVRENPKRAALKKAYSIIGSMKKSSQTDLLEFTMRTMLRKQDPAPAPADQGGQVIGII